MEIHVYNSAISKRNNAAGKGRSGLNMTQVLYVLAVAEHRNFSRAAESLFVSQPALSQQVAKLEKELGYPIFRRTPQGIFLTEQGEAFCKDARTTADAWQRLAQNASRRTRRLRVGMGSRVYSNGLFEDIVRFFDAHPEIEVAFVTEAGQDFFSGLKSGALDLALDRLPPKPLLSDWEEFSSYSLIRERQCVLMSAKDPRSTLPGISFSDLQGCTMITSLEDTMEDRTMKQECERYGITIDRLYRSDSIETIMNLVRGGKGVVLGPESFAPYFGVRAVALVPPAEVSLKFICLARDARRPEIVLFRNYLMKLCRSRRFD